MKECSLCFAFFISQDPVLFQFTSINLYENNDYELGNGLFFAAKFEKIF